MTEESDSVLPESPDLPRVRPMADPWAAIPSGGRCRQCPIHDARLGWCPVQAVRRAGRDPMCRYGYALADNKRKTEKETGEKR